MKDLKCGLKDCKSNKGYCCCASSIEVDEHTDCLTYCKCDDKRKNMSESGSDFPKANCSVDTEITCHAHCLFNSDNHCIANGITVTGETRNEATCLTFIKK